MKILALLAAVVLGACAPPPKPPQPQAMCILLMIRGDSVSVFLPPCNERTPTREAPPQGKVTA